MMSHTGTQSKVDSRPDGGADTWLIRFIDRFLPEHIARSTEDKKRQVRSALGFLMASWLMAGLFSIANFKQGNMIAGWFEVLSVGVLSATLPLIRRTGRYKLFGNIGMSTGVISIFLACWYADGLEAPPLVMLPLVPAFAYLGYGRASAIFWTWTSIALVVFLFVSERLGWVPEASGTPEKIQVKRFIEGALAIGFGFLAARVFTGIKDYAIGMLQLRTEELQHAHGRIAQLFDSMREGVLAFDAEGKIDSTVSARACAIFGQSQLEGQNVSTLLFQGVEDTTGLRESFDSFAKLVFEAGPEHWKELAECAPRELSRPGPDGQEQHLVLDFRPVLAADGKLRRVMLLVTDDSERVRLRRAVKMQDVEHRREVDELRRMVAGGAHLVLRFLEGSKQRLAETEQRLCGDEGHVTQAEDVSVAFQHVHTVRGEAQMFQFAELARVCNKIEDRLSPLRALGARPVVEPEVKLELRESLERARVLLDDAKARLVELSPVGEAVLDQITVRKSHVETLCALVTKSASAGYDLKAAAERLAARPFGESTQHLVTAAGTWAQASSKRVRVVVTGREEPVPQALGQVLSGVLTHLARNAVAHGVERLGERERLGKAPEATLRMSCEPLAAGVCIVVEDDGHGIDEVALRAAAARADLNPDASIDELLFAPGLSTSKDASLIAGRGIGMTAVRRDLGQAGYKICVTSDRGRGTRIEIRPSAVDTELPGVADNDGQATRVA